MKRLVAGCWCRDGDGDGGNHAVKVTGDQYLEGGAEVRIVEIKGTDVRFVGNTAGELSDAW